MNARPRTENGAPIPHGINPELAQRIEDITTQDRSGQLAVLQEIQSLGREQAMAALDALVPENWIHEITQGEEPAARTIAEWHGAHRMEQAAVRRASELGVPVQQIRTQWKLA